MSAEFLDSLPISKEERAKLSSLGADSPLKLLSLRKASKEAFDDYIGPNRAQAIAEELEKLLTDDELESLSGPLQKGGKLGARLGPPPVPKRSQGDS